MRALIQRVSKASVSVDGKIYSEISKGLLIFLGIEEADTKEDAMFLVKKISMMRIFSDSEGKMNLSLKDISGEVLVVSQFTLHASVKKGNRPSFIRAAKPALASELYEQTIELFKAEDLEVKSGIFGADMKVELINDGPVTIWIDSKNPE